MVLAILYFEMARNLKNLAFRSGYVRLNFLWNMTPRHSALCSSYFGQFSVQELSAEHYVLTVEHCVLNAEHYVLTAEHYVLTAEYYVLT